MATNQNHHKIRVLLVEDSEVFAGLVHDILLRARGKGDHELFSVTTLQKARELLGQTPVDVILLDLNLPDSKGLNSLDSLLKAFPGIPIVVLTAADQAHLDDKARQAGAQDFLYKDELHPRLLPRVLSFAIDRMRSQQRLLASEAMNRRLIEQAHDVIYRIDARGHFRFVNPAAETLTGYTTEQLLGKSFLSLIAPEFREQVLEHYKRQLRNGPSATYLEFAIRTKTGEERWVGQNVWQTKWNNGEVGFEAIVRDITELKQALANLEESRALLEEKVRQRTMQLEKAKLAWERTFDAVPDLILVTDRELNITRLNRSAARRIGREAQELLGLPCNAVLPGFGGLCVLPEHSSEHSDFSREAYYAATDADFLISTSPISAGDADSEAYVHVARDVTRLKKAERTVKEQLHFLQVVIDTIPNPLFFQNKYGFYTGSNAAFQKMVDLPAHEIQGKSVADLLPPEQANFIKEKDQQLLQNGGVQVYETRLRLSGGRLYDVINSKAVMYDSAGEVDGIVGVTQDITELRSAEKALRTSEEQFRTLFEQAPISIWEEDFSEVKKHLDRLLEQGVQNLETYFKENPRELFKCASLVKVININAYTLKMFGAEDKQELLGNLGKIFSEDSLPAFQQELLALHRGDKSISVAGYNWTLKGEKLYVLANVTLAPGSSQTWERVLVSVQDLTARMQAESALRESEKRYRNLVEALTEGLVQVDETACIRFFNKRFMEMTGYPKDELLGSPIFSFLDEDTALMLKEQFAKRRLGNTDTYELKIQTKSGPPLYTLVSPRPVFDAEGIFRGSFSLVTDLTKLKNLEGQLRQSQKMEAIGQLAAGIAHEINTPTQYVASNCKFLREGFKDLAELHQRTMDFLKTVEADPAYAEGVQDLHELAEEIDLEFLQEEIPKALAANMEGLDRIAVIVRSMKDFAHPGREEKQPTDLNQIIESTVTVARNEWKYVAEVETDLAPDLPLVKCVSNEIKQVILNIVVNAAQAIGEVVTEGVDQKGLIRISSRIEDGQAVITVSDTGPGIPPELRERVFDPFFTTKEPGKGTGQGLAIAYRAIVDNHGGKLIIDSRQGRGATFEIRLPLVEGGIEQ